MQLPAAYTFEERKTSLFQSIGITNTEELSEIEPITDPKTIRELIKISPSLKPDEQDNIYHIIESSGVLLKGHFTLLSGKHSKYFIRFSKMTRNTKHLKMITHIICDQLIENGLDFDTVLSPETAASSLAITISQILIEKHNKQIETIYAKTDELKMPTSLLNWIDLKANSRVLLVNDIISTGAGIRELVKLTEQHGGNVAGICVFTFRSEPHQIDILKKKYSKFIFSMTDASKLNNYTYNDANSCLICKTSKTKPIPSRYLN